MNIFVDMKKHLAMLEFDPTLTKKRAFAYCISHDIRYIAKYDKTRIKSLLDEGLIVCFCDKIGKCGIKPYLYSKEPDGKYYVHFYINYRNQFHHQEIFTKEEKL